MKNQQKNFLEWNQNILANSLKKTDKNIFLIVFLDIMFYFLAGILISFWLQRVQSKIASFNLPDVSSLSPGAAQQLLGEMKNFYYLIILSFVLLILIVIFLASIFKGIIWAKTTRTRITFELISRFLGLNLIWMSFWFALLILILMFFEPSSVLLFVIVAIIISAFLTNALYTLFMKKQKIKVIIDAVKLSFAKIHLFLLPYAIMLLLLYIITKLTSILHFDYSNIIANVILLVYIAVVRYYASALVLEVEAESVQKPKTL